MTILRAQINPLAFMLIDLVGKNAEDPTADQVVDYLSDPEGNSGLQTFLERYRDITSVEAPPLVAAPAEKTFSRNSCGRYGTLKATTRLETTWAASQYAEWSAKWLQSFCGPSQRFHCSRRGLMKLLFGQTFESLGQKRSVEVLRAFNLIDENTKQTFDNLRSIRNRYLHVFSQEHTNTAGDSRRAYADAFGLVFVVLGHRSFQNGQIVLRSDLMAYLTEHGLVESSSSAADGATTEG